MDMALNRATPLSSEQLLEGYAAAVNNALDLLRCSQPSLSIAPSVALAIAEVGQEELGKAYLLLAAAGVSGSKEAWKEFWRQWRRHDAKANAAFFFEWFNPIRIEMTGRNGSRLTGLSLRRSVSQEKSAGLYVDFDATLGRFVQPRRTVNVEEPFNRIGALITLGSNAMHIHTIISQRDSALRLQALGSVAATILGQFTPQESMPQLLDSLATRSSAHATLVTDFRALLPWCWRSSESDRPDHDDA